MIAVSDAIKLNNSYGKALYYKALWEYEAGNYEVAASTAERSSSYSEGAIKRSATLVAARAWYRLGDYIRSEGLFARVDNRFMTDHDQFCYGVVAYRAYRYEEARERFADLYKKHPENDEVMYNLAQSLFHSGNYLEAFGFFDRCASLDRYPYAKAHAQQCLEKLGV
jgi:tetratricopeptide (TPR) repeat protein